jgi:hypothetical protein
MPLVLRPPTDVARPLTERLTELGNSRRRAMLTAGLFRLIAIIIGMTTLACLLDAWLGLPSVLRAFGLVGLLSAGVLAYVRGIRRVNQEPTHPLAVALLLEDQFPTLNDSLATAVDFLQTDDKFPIRHNRFRQVTIIRAENLTKKVDLDRLIPSGKAWKAFWICFFTVMIATPFAIARPTTAGKTLQRLFDPFGSHPWPTQTTIEFLMPKSFPARLAKGEPFELQFKVQGLIPETGIMLFRLSGNAEQVEPLPLSNPDSLKAIEQTLKLDAGRVPRNFEFRLQIHDADTGWQSVTVSPPPRLVPLDGRPSPHMKLSFPAYTDLQEQELTDGSAVIDGPSGTRVEFRAATDRRISSASFQLQGELGTTRAGLALATLSSDNPLSAIASTLLAESMTVEIPVRVSGPEGTLLEAEFTPALPGLYALKFADEYGLAGVRLFDFRIVADPSPVVVLERPAPGKDALTLLPTANLNLSIHTEDRPYAVRQIALEYRLGTPDSPWRVMPLIDLQKYGPAAGALIGTAAIPPEPKPLSWDVQRKIPLSQFSKIDGKLPADGDILTLRAAAQDWDNRTALKPAGRSREVEIRLLNKSSLEAQFQKELAALRPELLRNKELQREVKEKTEELAKAAKEGPLTPEQLAKLAQAGEDQKQIRSKIADPADGLRAKVEQLRQTAKANELPRSPITDKIENATQELNRISDQNLENAEPLLSSAKQNAEARDAEGKPKPDSKKLTEDLNKAVKEQKSVEEGLSNLLERLEEWGGAGEVRGEARALKDQLQRAGNQAEKAAEKVPVGKEASKLNPNEKAELSSPADKLDLVAGAADKLIEKANRLADQKEAQAKADRAAAGAKEAEAAKANAEAKAAPAGSPEQADAKARAEAAQNEANAKKESAAKAEAEAKALREAVQKAGAQTLVDDIKKAADATRNNRPGESNDARETASQKLDQLTESLGEQPQPNQDELQKKREKFADELNKLSEQQDELRKKVKEAAKIPDEGQREAELEKLARKQEELERKSEILLQKLTREKQDKPAESLRRAAQQMQEAREQLEQGQVPTEKQEEALDRLDEALEKLDKEKKDDQEKLSQEKREELMELLKLIRDKQQAAVEEAKRLHEAATKAKQWSRAQLSSLGDLHDREKGLAEEVRGFGEKNLEELPVFAKLVKQSSEQMLRAARNIDERKQDAPRNASEYDAETEKLSDERVLRPMETALRKLDQIIGSLKEDPKKKDSKKENAGGGGGGGGGEGGGGQGGGVPPLAQLKALRAMQAEVNERTVSFAKDNLDRSKLTDDQREELKDLEQAQRDVAELFEKLAPLIRQAQQGMEGF